MGGKMEKILTISVAAYNVEKYLEKCLSSLVAEEIIDDIEVFVIDDGGKDGSLEIAKEYEAKYPNTVHAIHKENGGYGSTVNYSIGHAAGKYFKLLDGDDWFDTEGLIQLVRILKESEADVVVSEYYTGSDSDHLQLVKHGTEEGDEVTLISHLKKTEGIGMWALAYKTAVLRESGLKLPEHMLYTDQFYATEPMAIAKTMQFVRFPVYCYRIGYEEQSMSRLSRVKHTDNWVYICDAALDFCDKMKNRGCANYKYILMQTARCYSGTLKTLLMNPLNKRNLRRVKQYEKKAKQNNLDVYQYATKIGKMGKCVWALRKSHYLLYWTICFAPKKLLK